MPSNELPAVSNFNFLSDLESEIARARTKFPTNEDLLAALQEESGELAEALLKRKHEPGPEWTQERVWAEALQAAATAMRIATEGHAGFPYDPESGYRGPNWKGYKP